MGVLVVAEMPMRSGLPKDKVVNTFAIAEAGPGITGRDHEGQIAAAIIDFYTLTHATLGVPLGAALTPALSRVTDACSVKLYDITGHLDGSPHGSPFFVQPFTLPAASSAQAEPEEVAYCLTLEAKDRADQRVEVPDGADPDAKPDRPRQRYTGRLYLGPFCDGYKFTDAQGMCRPNNPLQGGVRAIGVRLSVAIDAIGPDQASLGVWSRKDRAIRGIDTVRTDDAWDTQRRRGASPTAIVRTTTGELIPEVELAA